MSQRLSPDSHFRLAIAIVVNGQRVMRIKIVRPRIRSIVMASALQRGYAISLIRRWLVQKASRIETGRRGRLNLGGLPYVNWLFALAVSLAR